MFLNLIVQRKVMFFYEKSPSIMSSDSDLSNKNDHLIHLSEQLEEKELKCQFCSISFSVESELTNHLKTHSGEKSYPCIHCKQIFCKKGGFYDHLKTHTGKN